MLTVDAIYWCILWFVLPYGVINVINNNNSSCSVQRLTSVVLLCGFWSLNFAPTTDELQYILPESERRGVRGVYAGLWVLLLFFTTAWSRDVTAAAHTFSLRSLPALAENFAGGGVAMTSGTFFPANLLAQYWETRPLETTCLRVAPKRDLILGKFPDAGVNLQSSWAQLSSQASSEPAFGEVTRFAGNSN